MKKYLFLIISICFICYSCNETNIPVEDDMEPTFYFDIVKFKDPKLSEYIPAAIVTDGNGEKCYVVEPFFETKESYPEYYNELKQGNILYQLHNDYCIVKYSNIRRIGQKVG